MGWAELSLGLAEAAIDALGNDVVVAGTAGRGILRSPAEAVLSDAVILSDWVLEVAARDWPAIEEGVAVTVDGVRFFTRERSRPSGDQSSIFVPLELDRSPVLPGGGIVAGVGAVLAGIAAGLGAVDGTAAGATGAVLTGEATGAGVAGGATLAGIGLVLAGGFLSGGTAEGAETAGIGALEGGEATGEAAAPGGGVTGTGTVTAGDASLAIEAPGDAVAGAGAVTAGEAAGLGSADGQSLAGAGAVTAGEAAGLGSADGQALAGAGAVTAGIGAGLGSADGQALAGAGAVTAGDASAGGSGYETEVADWISRVEAADGQALETAVKDAVNTFVVDTKADGSFAELRFFHLYRGPRTVAGCLEPLVGPTPVNNGFTSGDHDRRWLYGDGVGKFVDANVVPVAAEQNDVAIFGYIQSNGANRAEPVGNVNAYVDSEKVGIVLREDQSPGKWGPALFNRYLDAIVQEAQGLDAEGFIGAGRASGTSVTAVSMNETNVLSFASNLPDEISLRVFGLLNLFSAGIACAGYGTYFDVEVFKVRVDALMSAIDTALP